MGIQEANGITSSKNGRGCKAIEKAGKMKNYEWLRMWCKIYGGDFDRAVKILEGMKK